MIHDSVFIFITDTQTMFIQSGRIRVALRNCYYDSTVVQARSLKPNVNSKTHKRLEANVFFNQTTQDSVQNFLGIFSSSGKEKYKYYI